MGKGGANPYPGWWATSKDPMMGNKPKVSGAKPDKNKLPDDDIYKSKQDKQREYYDQYYKEKSYSERRKEFEEEFKKKFMRGDFFEFSSAKSNNSFSARDKHENDIHPIFKIKKSSSQEEFKKEYKKLILKHHPDKGGNSSMFIKIKEAYDNLFI